MMQDSLLLSVFFPFGTQAKEVSFPIKATVSQAIGQALQGSAFSPKDVVVVADPGGVSRYLNSGSPLRECQLSQRSHIWLFRKQQVCCVVTSDGARRRLLIDYTVALSEMILYICAKIGMRSYNSLHLHAYGGSEVLRNDKSLEAQGVTPFTRLFCLTTAEGEDPMFPVDAVAGFVSAPRLSMSDAAADLLNVPEEMLVRATKRGMLQKLNTKRGKYNPRLFVLQDSDLYYYTEAKAKKAKNVLHDPIAAPASEFTGNNSGGASGAAGGVGAGGATGPGGGALAPPAAVDEKKSLPSLRKNQNKEFEFVVSAGDKTIRLMCKTPEEGAGWIAAINASNSASLTTSGGAASKKGAIFRNKISAAVKVADGSQIPEIVTRAIEFLDRQSYLQVVGLFRLSGSAPVMKRISEEIDAGKPIDFSLVPDPHTVTGLLKLYFREMEEPLLTWDLYSAFVSSCLIPEDSLADRVRYLKQVIQRLPAVNRATLAVLMKFLAKVASYSQHNKMPLHNVATVFAPNILRDKNATMLQLVEASPFVNNTVISILQYHDYLLGDGPFPVKSEVPDTRAFACAHHPYDPAGISDLKLNEGDVVSVLVQGRDGWWLGECGGVYGRFPGSYVELLDAKEAEKTRKKVKIDVKIQEMREQCEHKDRVNAALRERKAKLQKELDALTQDRDQLLASQFPHKLQSTAVSMPQMGATARQLREGLEKLLSQSEQTASQEQELLIQLNGLWSAAGREKFVKKYKKVTTKLDPAFAALKTDVQGNIGKQREGVDVKADLVRDLIAIEAIVHVEK